MHTTYNLENIQTIFLNYLHTQTQSLNTILQPHNLYQSAHYYLTQMGGKRIRPLLCLSACAAMGSEPALALPVALGIEYFHNFSLAHDDIMDAAPLRRNKATMHTLFGQSTAILSGDLMLIKTYEYLLQTPYSHNIIPILTLMNTTATQLCEGQQLDLNFETQAEVTIPEYLQMIQYKTSVLLAAAAAMGAWASPNATQQHADLLYNFALNVGLAFQLKDDLLDTYGHTAEVGKQIGGDILQNKKTYLLICTLQKANSTQLQTLNRWLSTHTNNDVNLQISKINAVKQIFDELNIPQLTQQKIATYENEALQNLQNLPIPETQKQGLYQILELLAQRNN